MKVAYLGNFEPIHSTETHVAASIESLNHTILRIQEGATKALDLPAIVRDFSPDVFLHTQTQGLADSSGTKVERAQARDEIRAMSIPTVFFHLDLWWGLSRQEHLVSSPEPWAHYDYLFTADGGHQDSWASIGANHIWSPPGVYHAEAIDGTPDSRYTADVAFVGSWREYGHLEHRPYRTELIRRLKSWYGRRARFFPERGPAIRNLPLNNLYSSVKVVVGDSCLAASPTISNYCSDRIPETTGRGGFLLHPHVPGITGSDGIFPHVISFPAEDWPTLHSLIDYYLHTPDARAQARLQMVTDTRARHTYRHRLARILDIVMGAGEDTPGAEADAAEVTVRGG